MQNFMFLIGCSIQKVPLYMHIYVLDRRPPLFIFPDTRLLIISVSFVSQRISNCIADSKCKRLRIMTPSTPNKPTHRDRLLTDEGLLPNQNVTSSDNRFSMVMQTDGNLVLRGPQNQPMWSSGTEGNTDVFDVVMQGDGNLVVYDNRSNPLWASVTPGNPGATFIVYSDGNAVVYGTNNETLWATHTVVPPEPDGPTSRSQLLAGQGLVPGDSLDSQDGNWKLDMQADGNLVFYGPNNKATWASNTAGHSSVWDLVMQSDGNLVVFDASGNSLWASDTSGNPNATLEVEDGAFVIYNSKNEPIWSVGQAVATNGTGSASIATLTSTELLMSTGFTNSMGVSATANSTVNPSTASSNSSAHIGEILGGILGGAVLVLLVICIYLLLNRRKIERHSTAPLIPLERYSANLEPVKITQEPLFPSTETPHEEDDVEQTVEEDM
jgi:hypothetical protein